MNKILFWITFIFTVSGTQAAAESKSAAAEKQLKNRLTQDHIFASFKCLFFEIEQENAHASDFAIREIHDNRCPGDPAVLPVVERFRVESSGAILWLDIVEDEWISYKEFLKRRSR